MILIDDDIEKMQGVSNTSTGSTRLSNDPKQYVIVPHFRGSKDDKVLSIGGDVWTTLVRRIRISNDEELGDINPWTKRSVGLPMFGKRGKRLVSGRTSENTISRVRSRGNTKSCGRSRGCTKVEDVGIEEVVVGKVVVSHIVPNMGTLWKSIGLL